MRRKARPAGRSTRLRFMWFSRHRRPSLHLGAPMGCRAHLTTDLEQKKPTAPARPRLQSGRHVDHNTGDLKDDDKTQVGGQNRKPHQRQ